MSSAKATCRRFKYFIKAHLDYCILFDYFVEHGYMTIDMRKRLLTFSHLEIIDEMYNLLYSYVNDDVIDNITFKGLIATGQRDIVLKIFPDYIDQARKTALGRIYENLKFLEEKVDVPRVLKYINENKLYVAGLDKIQLKTHGMKTRSDERFALTFWSCLVTRIESAEHFDCNTDAFIQALRKTGQSSLVKLVFPEIMMIIHD